MQRLLNSSVTYIELETINGWIIARRLCSWRLCRIRRSWWGLGTISIDYICTRFLRWVL